MMLGEERHMLFSTEPQQGSSQERPARQIKGAPDLFCRQSYGLFLSLINWQGAQVQHGQIKFENRRDELNWLSFTHRKSGAQGFMSPDHFVERLFERRDIKLTSQAHRRSDVVSVALRLQ